MPCILTAKEQINVRAQFPFGAEDLLFGTHLAAAPGIALRGLQNARGRIDGYEEISEFPEAHRLFDVREHFGLPFQVVVPRTALRSRPGKFKRFIIPTEFNREISLQGDVPERWTGATHLVSSTPWFSYFADFLPRRRGLRRGL